jgi:hypothetical protein
MNRFTSLFLSAGLFAAAPVMAQDAKPSDHAWHFETTPYLWCSASSGTVGIHGLPELKVESSFSDTLSNFDFGILGRLEGRKGRAGFATDFIYLNLGIPLAENQPVILILGPEVDLRQFMGEGIGFYRLARSASKPDSAWLDVLGGARYTHARTEMELVGGSIASSTVDLVDAIGGLRGRAPLGSKAGFLARVDAGGGTSKVSWNVEASLTLAISKKWSLGAGYRYLHEKYDNESGTKPRTVDLTLKGPLVMATMTF